MDMCGGIRGRISVRRYTAKLGLRRDVEDSFRTINPQMLRLMLHRTWRLLSLCVQHQGYGSTGHVAKKYEG
jgi:hypothetical protein